jgi:hypothetical protein
MIRSKAQSEGDFAKGGGEGKVKECGVDKKKVNQ